MAQKFRQLSRSNNDCSYYLLLRNFAVATYHDENFRIYGVTGNTVAREYCRYIYLLYYTASAYIYYITQPQPILHMQPLARWNVFTILHELHNHNYIPTNIDLTLYYTKKSLLPCGIISPLLLQME